MRVEGHLVRRYFCSRMIHPGKVAALVLSAGIVATSASAQRSPGVVTKPAGKTLARPAASPAAKSPEFSRDQPQPADPAAEAQTIEPTPEEEPYLEAVKQGQVWAMTRLGVLYARAANDPMRWRAAVALLEKAGEQKDSEALFQLAMMATAGRGIAKSDTAAFDYCWRAAELGMPEAQCELASMYAGGRGITENRDAAINWARKAADRGQMQALILLARLLLESPDPASRDEALQRLHRSAQENRPEAVLFLARAYARGDLRVGVDEPRAEALLKPLAEKGNSDCQFALASLYKFGTTFDTKRDLVEEWLRRAAEGGNQEAARVLQGEK